MKNVLAIDQTIKLILNFVQNRISIFSLHDRTLILKGVIQRLEKLLDEINGSIKVYNSYNPKQENLDL